MPTEMRPYTGTWLCPLCLARIPVTLYGVRKSGAITFVESPYPMADAEWHIASEHPEGMADTS